MNHVESQMQYGLLAAGVSFAAYIAAGLLDRQWIGLIAGAAALAVFGVILKKTQKRP